MKTLIILTIIFSSKLFGQIQSTSVTTNSIVLIDTSKVIVDQSKRHPFKASPQINSGNGTQIKDSLVDVILDPSFQGTDEELAHKINAGELERYLVLENGKLYEKIRVPIVEDNESFIEKHFIVICGLLVIGLFTLYKFLGDKDDAKDKEEVDS